MNPEQITYNHGLVAEIASDVGQRAAHLLEIHDDIQQRTNAIAEFFEGDAGTAFQDAQAQMLRGLEGLIQTVSQHGTTIDNVNHGAVNTDKQGMQLFT